MSENWKHDDLARDLADHLSAPNRMIWTDMQMGPSGNPRPDVYTMQKSFANPRPVSYEIKISRSDFLSDVTSAKWQSYLKFSGGVIFAVPKGLITKNDVPQECGLIVRSDAGWKTLKRERPGTGRPDFTAMMKMLIDGVDRVREKREASPRRHDLWTISESVRKDCGEDVARILRDVRGLKDHVEYQRTEAAKMRDEAACVLRDAKLEAREKAEQAKQAVLREIEGLRVEAALALGLPRDSDWRQLRYKRRNIIHLLSEQGIVQDLEQEIRNLRSILKQAAEAGEKVLAHERVREDFFEGPARSSFAPCPNGGAR
ncbi:MmcB family DNA repair protein [Henriciella sp.]|uniref:MmcB family DNA repair protein n=1 Tax=Henriciella sp. TaxID=1968823 RepID=UPI000C0E7E4F|nr:MmcB family DNA repair protein [Henriciella sp.]PHR83120.1 MAG: hypothetical protein COA64_00245 [Henriciella sp.]